MDLRDFPVIDAHCHLIYHRYREHDLARTLSLSLENPPAECVQAGLLYHQILGELANLWWGRPDEPETVLRARQHKMETDYEGYVRDLFSDVKIEGMVVDLGYKPAATPIPDFERVVPGGKKYLFRIESVLDELWKSGKSFGEAEDQFREDVDAALAGGHAGLKTIIGYRTGLDVRPATRREAESGWADRDEKTVRDYFVLVAVEKCREHECPLQIHTGFGESNIDVRQNNPVALKTLLEMNGSREVPVILVHGGYPYSFEAGYMAAMYPNVYVDISEGIPWVALDAENMLRRILGVAPLNKVMFGSDGFIVPEISWIAAKVTKSTLGFLLEEMINIKCVTARYAEKIAAGILSGTAGRVFGFSQTRP